MKRKNVILTLTLVFLGLAGGFLIWYYNDAFSYSRSGEKNISFMEKIITGSVYDISLSSNVIIIKDNGGVDYYLAMTPETKFLSQDNNKIDISYAQKGFVVWAKGKADNGNSMIASEIKIVREPNIIVFNPRPNNEISPPLILKGIARVFENSLNYELKDEENNIIAKNFMTADAPDTGKFGAYETEIYYSEPKGERGNLEVFNYSAKDGSKENVVVIPVSFKKIQEFTTVKIFFGNIVFDPDVADCEKAYEIERRIPKTESVARGALEELLKGPTKAEDDKGFITSINKGVKIQKLVIENGTAKVDFDSQLEYQTGGSCRVAAIRNQIKQTLLQFPSVSSVLISIDGRTEDILQP